MRRIFEPYIERSLNELDKQLGPFYQSLNIEDCIFVKQTIRHYPSEIQELLISRYREFDSAFAANCFLREKCKKLSSITSTNLLPYLTSNEEELRELAESESSRCKRFELRQPNLESPLTGLDPVNGNSAVYYHCAKLVNGFGIKAPQVSKTVTLTGAIKRMQDKYWWLRKLRKVVNRNLEQINIELAMVNSRRGKYCSNLTLKRRRAQKQRQLLALDSLLLVNEFEQSYSLKDIYEKNVSNPVNRRHEMMTRLAGCEKLAKHFGHAALFITLTCPSKYHNSYSRSGDRNPKWDGSTPYDGQQYLNLVWSRIRAELARQKIRIYGFRICEPQHDGTPHWHLLLFLEPEHKCSLQEIVSRYSLQEDGDEKGAEQNRVDFKDIDYSKGSATGYVAKYVSKNIDGQGLDEDLDGGNASLAAQRVEAWASCWGIRQFQQIGAGSVTVWRELRRLKDFVSKNSKLCEVYQAANRGDWAEFVILMGGVFCKRVEQLIRPFYAETININTGQIKQSWFDGLITKKLKGIIHQGRTIITRVHDWKLFHRSEKADTAFSPLLGVL